jgi:hypothetical protein
LEVPKEPRDIIPPGDKFEFYDRKKKAWIPLEELVEGVLPSLSAHTQALSV